MEQQQQGLSITAEDLYAVIGQLTIENRVLRARLRALEEQLREAPAPGNGQAQWKELEPVAEGKAV